METANKVYRRKKKNIKWGRFVIIALAIAYIIMFVYTFFAQSIETTNIVYGELEVAETVYGYITRNEQIVTSNLNGDLYPVMNEGERVSKGQAVAVVKNDNSDVISAIKDLKEGLNNNGPSYTINGITYDDGSNITSAVETLVRAAKIERRI